MIPSDKFFVCFLADRRDFPFVFLEFQAEREK